MTTLEAKKAKAASGFALAGELVEDDRVDKLNSRSSHGNFEG